MERIKSIEIRFPDLTEKEKGDNDSLFKLLAGLENIAGEKDYLLSKDTGLYPRIAFRRAAINNPQISFIGGKKIGLWQAGKMDFGFNLSDKKERPKEGQIKQYRALKDNIGNYLELKSGINKYYLLTVEELFKRFAGRLKELNHTGINFGPTVLDEENYLLFKKKITDGCNLYRYPTGEEWPFIIPSSDEEFLNDIKNEKINRNPKFEIVYSSYHQKPLIQLDIETKLTKEELTKLLPRPYGISFAGLEDFFRVVFVFTDWDEVILRFDLRFKSTGKDFGYWLIKKGGRINTAGSNPAV